MKTGILLLNLGGPSNLREVRSFLYRLFSDPDILVGIRTPFRQALAWLIANLKGSGSVKMYAQIGGGSPQLRWTQAQADGLSSSLRSQGWDVLVRVGMRASSPTIEGALQDLHLAKVDRLILFPLFPHFSTTTTGSCLKEARRALGRLKWQPEVLTLESWADHPGYVDLLHSYISEGLQKFQRSIAPHILISAHSLPMKIVERGDPYLSEVQKTVQALSPRLNQSWSLAFQSRNGPIPWLKPYVEDEIKKLGQQDSPTMIVPISFVSDHVETLYEIDILYRALAAEAGVPEFGRTASFNADPRFISLLSRIIVEKFGQEKDLQRGLARALPSVPHE